MQFEIREYGIDQTIPIVQGLADRCFMVAYRGIHSEEQNSYMFSMMYSSESLERQIRREDSRFLIVHADGVPCGYCAFKPVLEEKGVFLLDKLYVLPEMKGHGLGRLLVEKMEELAMESCDGSLAVRLDVNRSNSARSFYEHLGFRVVDSWDAPIGRGYSMNAYTMEKEIRH